ncbi:MAG: hypothetical protein WBC91_07570 [Phototrophicaceae bacterium]
MKNTFLGLITLTMLLLVSWIPVAAQSEMDLYVTVDGDIWSWSPNGVAEQLTEWGFNGNPVLSPDGRKIAYASVAREAVQQGGDPRSELSYLIYVGTPTNNIWVMDTATGDFTQIVNQGDGFPIKRGVPVWSPTGDELAWVEYRNADTNQTFGARLMIYNFADDSLRDVASINLGFQDAGLRLPRIDWGAVGISYSIFTFVESGNAETQLYVIDPITGNSSQFILYADDAPFSQNSRFAVDYMWVEHDSLAQIAILYSDNTWSLLDPIGKSQVILSDAPYLLPRNGSNATLTPFYDATERRIGWTVVAGNGTVTDLDYYTYGLTNAIPALSPDGSALITIDTLGVNYRRIDGDGTFSRILQFDIHTPFYNIEASNAVWTPMQWLTTGRTGARIPTPIAPNPATGSIACDLPIPFTLGDLITVQAGVPNNVRNGASISADYIVSLYAGALVSVMDGPVCADGLRWWQIAGEGGFSGWTAEGAADGSEAWLLRLVQSPLINDCPLPPRLSRGQIGIVLAGIPNVLRDGPDVTGTTIIGSLPADSQFTVLGDSLCGMDGRRWYPINYEGEFGWTAEGEGSTYWIAPMN